MSTWLLEQRQNVLLKEKQYVKIDSRDNILGFLVNPYLASHI